MKDYILFRIKREALDFERLFFLPKFEILIKMIISSVSSEKINKQNHLRIALLTLIYLINDNRLPIRDFVVLLDLSTDE